MRKSTFQGFQPGPVRVRVTQGESVKDAAFTLTAPPDGKGEGPTSPDDFAGTLDLSANRLEGIAPCGIAFEVEADGFGVGDHYHDLRYRWSFGDPGHYTRHDVDDMPWDRVYDVDGAIRIVRGIDIYDADGTTLLETQDRAPAVPSGQRVTFLGNDRNIAYGPRVVHVFEKPGSYTVTCEALSHQMVAEGQDPVLKTLTVEVKDMLDAVPRHRVACILGEAPAGAEPEGALVFRTYLDAMNAVRNSTAPVAFLFRRGQKHAIDNSVNWGNTKTKISVAGAYGPEKNGDPVLDKAPNIEVEKTQGTQLIYTGLKLKGPYDSTDPYSITSRPGNGIRVDSKWGGYATIWNCDLSGFDLCIEGAKYIKNLTIGNCFIHSWMNYGIFMGDEAGNIGLCGVWAKQPVGTVTGSSKSEGVQPFIADHGPFRCSQTLGVAAFNLCDLRSLNSWSGYFQPCLRIGGMGERESPESSENVVERVRGEMGGCIGASMFYGNSFPKRAVYDKIYQALANGSGNGGLLGFSCPGITIRNTFTVVIDQPQAGGQKPNKWVNYISDPYDPSVVDYGISIYNSTFVDLRNDANGPSNMSIDYAGFSLFKYFDFENNILSRPNRSVPVDEFGPLDRTVLWSVTYDGLRYEGDPFNALYAAAPDTAALYAPTGNSAAIGAATEGRVAVDDFFGRIRDPKKAAPSKGAVEPI